MTSLRWAAVTDVGRVRDNNEDQVLADEPLFAVADGMGGHAAGEVASQVAVDTLRSSFTSSSPPSADGLAEAVREANRAVFRRSQDDGELRGMGTTLTAAALVEVDGEDRLAVVNVGDSRAYLLRDGELHQLTDDHSLVEELVRAGELAPEDASEHPQKHILTRVLGMDSTIEVDSFEVIPYRGDRVLLASDGLSNEVSDNQVASVLRRLDDPDDAARELVRLAKANGGNDNISVVLIDVVDDDDRAGTASRALADEPPAVRTGRREPDGGPATAATTAATGPPRVARTRPSRPKGRPGWLTPRVIVFVGALVLVVGLGAVALAAYSRGSYFVDFGDDDSVTIYQGRPGGLLWMDPRVEQGSDLDRDDLTDSEVVAVERRRVFSSRAAAEQFVANLEQQVERRTTTTTTTPAPTTAPTAPPLQA